MDQQERYIVTENMINFGGSFIQHLGKAIRRADPTNYRKLKNTFPEYWEKYYNDRELMGTSYIWECQDCGYPHQGKPVECKECHSINLEKVPKDYDKEQ